MTYATTFSGIGGWELGLNACGWELKWQCERDPVKRSELRRFGVPIYEDIRTIIGLSPQPVDVLVGSPPCQPFSRAGQMLGVRDQRHLLPAFAELVGAIKPRWLLLENVARLVSDDRAFGEYLSELAALRFDVVWHCVPSCSVGAPQERDRVWLIGRSVADADRAWELQQERRIGHERRRSIYCAEEGHSQWRTDWRENLRALRLVDDGIPVGLAAVGMLGDALTPQIPYLIGQAINQIETLTP